MVEISQAAAGMGPCVCDTHTEDTMGGGGGSKSVVVAFLAAVATAEARGGV